MVVVKSRDLEVLRHAENIARGKKETLIVSNKHKEYVNLGF